MTRFPTESRDVVGLEGEEYELVKVGPMCAAPGCTRLNDHSHHLFSRGQMGKAFDWVRLPDGTEVSNRAPLCWRHHQDVTENRVHITYVDGLFLWDPTESDEVPQPLSSQPPKKSTDPVGNGFVTESHGIEGHVVETHVAPVCESCGQKIRPKMERDPEAKKARKTWAVSVPATSEEDGADTLDALLDAAREEMDKYGLDWGQGHKVKFHVLSTALSLFVLHSQTVLNNAP